MHFNIGDRVIYDRFPNNPATIIEHTSPKVSLLEFDFVDNLRLHDATRFHENRYWYTSHALLQLLGEEKPSSKYSNVISKIKYLDKKFKERKEKEVVEKDVLEREDIANYVHVDFR
jgi:hypothetical protein